MKGIPSHSISCSIIGFVNWSAKDKDKINKMKVLSKTEFLDY